MATITLETDRILYNLGFSFKSATQKASDLVSSLRKLKTSVISVQTVVDIGSSSNSANNTELREEHKSSALSVAYDKPDKLLSDVSTIDNRVASVIANGKNELYKRFPWLKPESEKGFLEKAGEYLWNKACSIGNAIIDLLSTEKEGRKWR